jgi:hypothetical protein
MGYPRNWIVGDDSGAQTLTEDDHLYETHINELRKAVDNNVVINVLDYGAVGDGVTDDTTAITDALTASLSANRPLYFPKSSVKYLISSPILITDTNTVIISDPRAVIDGGSTCTDCFQIYGEINFLSKWTLPIIQNFTSAGIHIKGANLLDIWVAVIQGCGDGILIECDATYDVTLDNNIRGIVINDCDYAIRCLVHASGDTIQGYDIDFNFINGNTTGLMFDGSGFSPNVNLNTFRLLAVEGAGAGPTARGINSNCAFLSGNVFDMSNFLGGCDSGGINIITNGSLFIFNASPASDEINNLCSITGVGNKIINLGGARGYIGAPITAVTSSNDLANFNSGYKLISNDNIIRFTLGVQLNAGSTKDFYIHSVLVDGYSNLITVQPYNGNKACVFAAIQDVSIVAGVDENIVVGQILFRLYAIENMAAGNYDFLVKVGY